MPIVPTSLSVRCGEGKDGSSKSPWGDPVCGDTPAFISPENVPSARPGLHIASYRMSGAQAADFGEVVNWGRLLI